MPCLILLIYAGVWRRGFFLRLLITDPGISKRKPDWADRWRFLAMGNPIRELRVTRRYPRHSRQGFKLPTDQSGSHWRMTFLNLWSGMLGGGSLSDSQVYHPG